MTAVIVPSGASLISLSSLCVSNYRIVYLDRVSKGERGWPVSPLIDGVADIENVTRALEDGPYGRCVYECDNDVCDNQVVNLEFADGRTASFTMVAFTSLICDRQLRMHFTHGEIVGDMNKYTVTDFRLGKSKTCYPKNEGGGHGGGDLGLIRAFVEAIRTGKQDILGTNVTDVLRSHLTVFAAEMSRREGSVINFTDFEKEHRGVGE
jgi:predicted dehydrogenase